MHNIHKPEILAILKTTFHEVCSALPPEHVTQSMRALVAECILKAAASGERDPVSLRAHALRSIEGTASRSLPL
jgi:hypothetical protein